MNNIDDMVEELLGIEPDMDDGGKITLPGEAQALIHAIAEKCKKIPMVRDFGDKAEEYGKNMSPEEVYIDMLVKINDAPTSLHMKAVPRLLIPVISKKLREGATNGRKESDEL